MQVTVKLFGSVREAAGVKELSVGLDPGATLGDLRELLARDHAIIRQLGDRLAASVNFEVEPWGRALCDGDEVAFLPPVAGGAPRCSLSEHPLDPGEVVSRVSGPGMGGLVTFIGAVRDEARGARIRHLEYEAYPGMAEREMEKICVTAAERWPEVRVAIAHRVGHLEIGDLAVVIAAAAPHRGEAFEACRFTIDTLKETVPIWKKEFAESGEYWVDDRP
jgi:molybdopterin synthase catalytic subunit